MRIYLDSIDAAVAVAKRAYEAERAEFDRRYRDLLTYAQVQSGILTLNTGLNVPPCGGPAPPLGELLKAAGYVPIEQLREEQATGERLRARVEELEKANSANLDRAQRAERLSQEATTLAEDR